MKLPVLWRKSAWATAVVRPWPPAAVEREARMAFVGLVLIYRRFCDRRRILYGQAFAVDIRVATGRDFDDEGQLKSG